MFFNFNQFEIAISYFSFFMSGKSEYLNFHILLQYVNFVKEKIPFTNSKKKKGIKTFGLKILFVFWIGNRHINCCDSPYLILKIFSYIQYL